MTTTIASVNLRHTASLPSRPLTQSTQQVRHASLLRRPRRPYTFTQLITLSDGSAFLARTTSPLPVLRCTKDIRNHPLWNPSSQKLLNVEEDEAGRLRTFRGRFGRGWDAETTRDAAANGEERSESPDDQQEESLLDLITGFGIDHQTPVDPKNSKLRK
jgi:Ribosomal protein L31